MLLRGSDRLRASSAQQCFDRGCELVGREWLGQKNVGHTYGTLHGFRDGAVTAHERDRKIGPVESKLARESDAVLQIEPHIQKDGIDPLLGEQPNGSHAVSGLQHAITLVVEDFGEQGAKIVVVLCDENR